MDQITVEESANDFSSQDYSSQDLSLLNKSIISREFGAPQDVIELHIYNGFGERVSSNYNFKNYNTQLTENSSSLFTNFFIDPEQDVKTSGFNYGRYTTSYFPYRNIFLSDVDNRFFIKEISSTRTEIQVTTNNISFDALGTSYYNYLVSKNSKSFYSDFLINFGDNNTFIGVNTLLDTELDTEPTLYIKLYEPLPDNYQVKDTLWFSEPISEPLSFEVNIEFIPEEIEDEVEYLRGPNTNVEIVQNSNVQTQYFNASQLFDSSLTSSIQQIKSILEEKSVDINIDYSEYENFVHFSSGYQRLSNFKSKLTQIQSYQSDLNSLTSIPSLTDTSYISSSKSTIQQNIDGLIENFDGYEYFLYFDSGSKSWPKTNTSPPYNNYSVTSATASIWYGSADEDGSNYGGQILSASLYDNLNKNYIWNNLPSYIVDDSQNSSLELLSAMLGQHFDTLWTYTKAIGDLKDADNRVDYGISKDLVANALRSLGVKLYTSNRTNQDLFESLLGLTPSGSLSPSTGSLRVETYVSASNDVNTFNNLNKEVYKRLYHNLPYLLKTKGTLNGLRALLNCFGIPETILKVNEFGGDQKDVPTVNQFIDKFAYGLNTNPSESLSSISSSVVRVPWLPFISNLTDIWDSTDIDWDTIEGLWNGPKALSATPDTLEFRFKTKGIPSSSYYSQSLFQVNSGSNTQFGIQLLYPSASNSDYDSPITNAVYSTYGELRLFLSGSQGYTKTNPIYLPFFSGSWWSVKLNRETGSIPLSNTGSNNQYTLTVKSTDYDGKDGTYIKYAASESISINGSNSASYNGSWNDFHFSSNNSDLHGYLGGTGSNNVLAQSNTKFDGYFQEIRLWSTILSKQAFDQHVLDPRSIRSNQVTSSRFDLVYRLPLGNDLKISGSNGNNIITSVHPSITGSIIPTGSGILGTGSSTVGFGVIEKFTTSSYTPIEYYSLIESPNLGAYNYVDDKIRIIDTETISGSVLSPYISTQHYPDNRFTLDTNDIEIAISPQDSINRDITEQLGYFNIDEYIGDPKLALSSSYKGLDQVRDFYFEKYFRKQNVHDVLNLLSYFDSSLFKMVEDFVPAKAELSTGFLIKPHLLERSKMKRFEPNFTYLDYSGSFIVPSITGSNAFNLDLNTSFTESVPIYSGSDQITSQDVLVIRSDNRETFTGEYSGSEFTAYSLPTSNVVTEKSFFRTDPTTKTAVSFSLIPLNPTLNNISESRKSNNYLDLDYSSDQIVPLNFNLVASRSLGLISEQSSKFLNAEIQNSNYTLLRNINPRYLGSKTTSQKYNTYTIGDNSFGSTAAIDLNSLKFAYFEEIIETGSILPNRSNIYVKYLIDGNSNVIELTRGNEFIFELQTIFNQEKEVDISLDNNQEFSDQKYLDGLKPIYAGGFKYSSILQNPTGSSTLLYDISNNPIINRDSNDLLPVPLSLGGRFLELNNFELGNIIISSGSNFVSVAGTPSLKINRNAPINRDTVWWDNKLVANIEGQFELEVKIPKNVSASIDDIKWNPFNNTEPLISSSVDLGNFALLKATYYISNSVEMPKNTDSTEAILQNSNSALGGYFETSFNNPEIVSASVNIGLQSLKYSTPEYTYYYPSEPVINITGSISDSGDANNGNAFFLRNNTGSFNILTASVSMSYWFDSFIQTSSVFESGSDSYGVVDEVFNINEGDLFRFVDTKGGVAGSGSGEFPREFERQVKKVNTILRDEVTNTRRITIEFDQDIPARACEDFTTPANAENARQIKRFVILKKVPDETNIVLDFPKQPGKTSPGIILPSDAPKSLSDQAGNIIKELKSQNLI
ncbi:hypothetical protein OAE25_00115 [Verrucomicrobiales bacterium]|nr:hypothetical protein [Verrucomicrobiales bacterium]